MNTIIKEVPDKKGIGAYYSSVFLLPERLHVPHFEVIKHLVKNKTLAKYVTDLSQSQALITQVLSSPSYEEEYNDAIRLEALELHMGSYKSYNNLSKMVTLHRDQMASAVKTVMKTDVVEVELSKTAVHEPVFCFSEQDMELDEVKALISVAMKKQNKNVQYNGIDKYSYPLDVLFSEHGGLAEAIINNAAVEGIPCAEIAQNLCEGAIRYAMTNQEAMDKMNNVMMRGDNLVPLPIMKGENDFVILEVVAKGMDEIGLDYRGVVQKKDQLASVCNMHDLELDESMTDNKYKHQFENYVVDHLRYKLSDIIMVNKEKDFRTLDEFNSKYGQLEKNGMTVEFDRSIFFNASWFDTPVYADKYPAYFSKAYPLFVNLSSPSWIMIQDNEAPRFPVKNFFKIKTFLTKVKKVFAMILCMKYSSKNTLSERILSLMGTSVPKTVAFIVRNNVLQWERNLKVLTSVNRLDKKLGVKKTLLEGMEDVRPLGQVHTTDWNEDEFVDIEEEKQKQAQVKAAYGKGVSGDSDITSNDHGEISQEEVPNSNIITPSREITGASEKSEQELSDAIKGKTNDQITDMVNNVRLGGFLQDILNNPINKQKLKDHTIKVEKAKQKELRNQRYEAEQLEKRYREEESEKERIRLKLEEERLIAEEKEREYNEYQKRQQEKEKILRQQEENQRGKGRYTEGELAKILDTVGGNQVKENTQVSNSDGSQHSGFGDSW